MIYLREARGLYIGPFKSRRSAEDFINLMVLCGEGWADAELVDAGETDAKGLQPDPALPIKPLTFKGKS